MIFGKRRLFQAHDYQNNKYNSSHKLLIKIKTQIKFNSQTPYKLPKPKQQSPIYTLNNSQKLP